MSPERLFEALPGRRVCSENPVPIEPGENVGFPVEDDDAPTVGLEPIEGRRVDQDRRFFKKGQPGVVEPKDHGVSESQPPARRVGWLKGHDVNDRLVRVFRNAHDDHGITFGCGLVKITVELCSNDAEIAVQARGWAVNGDR